MHITDMITLSHRPPKPFKSRLRIGKNNCDAWRQREPVGELAAAFGIGRATAQRYLSVTQQHCPSTSFVAIMATVES